ncbi:MAG: hypothetical protein Q8N77_05015 [Nanoarchaeota archaeon]|nr:hypothetical protein [Nanoarchaeota archaeon]
MNNILKLLNLDTSSRQRLINSHPLLKKYFLENSLKRNPKRLDSPLAKKLEDPKHRLTEQYYSLKDIYKILEISEFDQLRKNNYLMMHESIMKITDPETQNYQLSQLYSQIKQDIKYFIGKEEKLTEDLPLEDQIQHNILLGSKDFKK